MTRISYAGGDARLLVSYPAREGRPVSSEVELALEVFGDTLSFHRALGDSRFHHQRVFDPFRRPCARAAVTPEESLLLHSATGTENSFRPSAMRLSPTYFRATTRTAFNIPCSSCGTHTNKYSPAGRSTVVSRVVPEGRELTPP